MSYLTDRAGLQGKVAVVTGGAGGLGWPIARDLARAGVSVAVCDRDPEAVAEATRLMGELDSPSLVEHADVREPEVMERFFARVDETFGRVDVLVVVPGGGFLAPLMDTNANGWNAIIRQNFTHVLDTTQRAVRRMRAQGGGGSVIYVSSIEGHRAIPNQAVYGAMKAGLASLAKTLALELAVDAVRVNTVAPDIFPTPASMKYFQSHGDDTRDALKSSVSIPMGRTGTGEDLSGCVLFLASELAAYVTGTTVHVDGGTLASSGWFNWPGVGWLNMPPDEVLDAASAAESGDA